MERFRYLRSLQEVPGVLGVSRGPKRFQKITRTPRGLRGLRGIQEIFYRGFIGVPGGLRCVSADGTRYGIYRNTLKTPLKFLEMPLIGLEFFKKITNTPKAP